MKWLIILLVLGISCTNTKENIEKESAKLEIKKPDFMEMLGDYEIHYKYCRVLDDFTNINFQKEDFGHSPLDCCNSNLKVSKEKLLKIGIKNDALKGFSLNRIKDKKKEIWYYVLGFQFYGESSDRKYFYFFDKEGNKLQGELYLANHSDMGFSVFDYAVIEANSVKSLHLNILAKNVREMFPNKQSNFVLTELIVENGVLRIDTLQKGKYYNLEEFPDANNIGITINTFAEKMLYPKNKINTN